MPRGDAMLVVFMCDLYSACLAYARRRNLPTPVSFCPPSSMAVDKLHEHVYAGRNDKGADALA